jgi:hypothetical protein
VTFDATSRLARATNPANARNFRTPALDLDSVYGAGPVAQQELYDAGDPIKLKIESGGVFEDPPRRADGAAIIGDPRNDEHVIIAGLHCAFLLFHNHAVDYVREHGRLTEAMDVFAQARRLTIWHYHWLIVHEFLPQIVGQTIVADVLRYGRRFYRPRPDEAFIPVEFQTGTYQDGPQHRPSLVPRESRRRQRTAVLRLHLRRVAAGQSRRRRPARRQSLGAPVHRLADLLRLRRRRGQTEQETDTRISTPLFTLPLVAIASHDAPIALPQRNLLRHLTWQLPSGQCVAHTMGATPLVPGDLQELAPLDVGFERSTPLW